MNGQLETLKWLIENGCSIHDRKNDGISCVLAASMMVIHAFYLHQ